MGLDPWVVAAIVIAALLFCTLTALIYLSCRQAAKGEGAIDKMLHKPTYPDSSQVALKGGLQDKKESTEPYIEIDPNYDEWANEEKSNVMQTTYVHVPPSQEPEDD